MAEPPTMRNISAHTGAEDEEAEGEEAGGEELGEDGEKDEPAERREIKWSLPEGLNVKAKPALLDAALVGCLIYMRWPTSYGWLIGKVSEKFTTATPRLYSKFNYRVTWQLDGWENHKLNLNNYQSGPTAPYNSWALLEKEAVGAGGSD